MEGMFWTTTNTMKSSVCNTNNTMQSTVSTTNNTMQSTVCTTNNTLQVSVYTTLCFKNNETNSLQGRNITFPLPSPNELTKTMFDAWMKAQQCLDVWNVLN